MRTKTDLTGQTINSWEVLKKLESAGKIPRYLAKCLECATEYSVDGRNIKNGKSKRCVSCGHKHSDKYKYGMRKSNFTMKELKEKYLLNQKRKDAVKRGRAWTLSQEQFNSMIYKKCFYCGTIPKTTTNVFAFSNLSPERVKSGEITYNGIDRIDNALGYTWENTVACCSDCNKSKHTRTAEAFKAWIADCYLNLFK
jgi:hypothetical protein